MVQRSLWERGGGGRERKSERSGSGGLIYFSELDNLEDYIRSIRSLSLFSKITPATRPLSPSEVHPPESVPAATRPAALAESSSAPLRRLAGSGAAEEGRDRRQTARGWPAALAPNMASETMDDFGLGELVSGLDANEIPELPTLSRSVAAHKKDG